MPNESLVEDKSEKVSYITKIKVRKEKNKNKNLITLAKD